MNDKYIGSGQPRGYGFVEMASKSDGEAAMAGLKGTVINGRHINIVEALPLERKVTGFISKRLTQPRHRA
jgi:RNA recognition motif-containing protein